MKWFLIVMFFNPQAPNEPARLSHLKVDSQLQCEYYSQELRDRMETPTLRVATFCVREDDLQKDAD